jgi:DNA-binding LacI/PurR family transcriptional regulator
MSCGSSHFYIFAKYPSKPFSLPIIGILVARQEIAGFNDDPVSSMVEPSLTTVMQPGYEVGKLSMRMLVDEINSPASGFQNIQLRTQLIIRNSSK